MAVQQVKQFEYQLLSVLKIIKNLEKDIENEKKIIELINKKNELLNAIKDAKKVTELSEVAHNSAKKYASLLIAIGLAKEIEEDYKKEKKLLNDLNNYKKVSAVSVMNTEVVEDKQISRKNKSVGTIKYENDDENEVENVISSIEDYKIENNKAIDNVTRIQSALIKEKKISLQLQNEEIENKDGKNKAEKKLNDREIEIKSSKEEGKLLSEVMTHFL